MAFYLTFKRSEVLNFTWQAACGLDFCRFTPRLFTPADTVYSSVLPLSCALFKTIWLYLCLSTLNWLPKHRVHLHSQNLETLVWSHEKTVAVMQLCGKYAQLFTHRSHCCRGWQNIHEKSSQSAQCCRAAKIILTGQAESDQWMVSIKKCSKASW